MNSPGSAAQTLEATRQEVLAALEHLAYSYERVRDLDCDAAALDEAQLERWEAFIARFGRASDLFVAKYVRAFVLYGDPAFRGSLRDHMNQAEKLGLVEDAEVWMGIREQRNIAAHEYAMAQLHQVFATTRDLAPVVLALRDTLAEPTQ